MWKYSRFLLSKPICAHQMRYHQTLFLIATCCCLLALILQCACKCYYTCWTWFVSNNHRAFRNTPWPAPCWLILSLFIKHTEHLSLTALDCHALISRLDTEGTESQNQKGFGKRRRIPMHGQMYEWHLLEMFVFKPFSQSNEWKGIRIPWTRKGKTKRCQKPSCLTVYSFLIHIWPNCH